jgi:NADH-quinone oxidoreductase subunit A
MEYLPVLVLMAAGVVIGGAVLLITTWLGPKLPNKTKDSPAECGVPITENVKKQRVSVRFYLVAILFIIFDLEAAFLFPWAVSLGETGWIGWGTMMLFLFELVIGFIYAWKVGALEWE